TEIRYHPRAVGELPAHFGAGGDAKADIVLAQGTRRATEWVDVAAERAAIADKSRIEVLPVIECVGAHHSSDLHMTPRVIDAGGADNFGPSLLQRVKKRGVRDAGRRHR